MSDDEDSDEPNVLEQASNLNLAIKGAIENIHNMTEENKRVLLTAQRNDINYYLENLRDQNFPPRQDRLTKDGIIKDLQSNLSLLNSMLSSSNRGGGKRSSRKGSRRNRRSNKRKNHSRKRKNSRKRRKY